MNSNKPETIPRMRHHHDDEAPIRHTALLSPDMSSVELEPRQAFDDDVMKKHRNQFCKTRYYCVIGVAIVFLCFTIGFYSSIVDDSDAMTPRDIIDYDVDLTLDEEVTDGDVVDDVVDDADIIAEAKTKFDAEDSKSFVIVVGDENVEVTLDQDGSVVLPDGKNLNPHDRNHWEVIQAVLGDAYYDYDVDQKDDNETDSNAALAADAGLKYVPPDVDEEHEHDDDCEQTISVNVADETGDSLSNETGNS
ncbi:uncharacterized protein LOC100178603 isoform X2 [Ciona intestinalis]